MSLQLAYCGLDVSDVAEWTRFGADALGMMAEDHHGLRRFRLDDKSWRFALYDGKEDDILYAGFECAGPDELAAHRESLTGRGIQCVDLDAAVLAERQVDAGFRFSDPDGLMLELVVGHKNASTPFNSNLSSGFVTGDQGLGHIVLGVSDLDTGRDFYEKLGFSLSDYITQDIGGGMSLRVAFLHCNPRHHSLAIAVLPPGKRLNHIMIECQQVDDVLRGHRRCLEQGYGAGQIGRHPNDDMLSFYVVTPSGFDIECGWGGKQIRGEWSISEYDRFSLWGHERAV